MARGCLSSGLSLPWEAIALRIFTAAGHSTDATEHQVWEHGRCLEAVRILDHLLQEAGVDVLSCLPDVYALPNNRALRTKIQHANDARVDLASSCT